MFEGIPLTTTSNLTALMEMTSMSWSLVVNTGFGLSLLLEQSPWLLKPSLEGAAVGLIFGLAIYEIELVK